MTRTARRVISSGLHTTCTLHTPHTNANREGVWYHSAVIPWVTLLIDTYNGPALTCVRMYDRIGRYAVCSHARGTTLRYSALWQRRLLLFRLVVAILYGLTPCNASAAPLCVYYVRERETAAGRYVEALSSIMCRAKLFPRSTSLLRRAASLGLMALIKRIHRSH